jgi:hypothetical protein
MITQKEKNLTIQLLIEKLQRISGKKVVLKEAPFVQGYERRPVDQEKIRKQNLSWLERALYGIEILYEVKLDAEEMLTNNSKLANYFIKTLKNSIKEFGPIDDMQEAVSFDLFFDIPWNLFNNTEKQAFLKQDPESKV